MGIWFPSFNSSIRESKQTLSELSFIIIAAPLCPSPWRASSSYMHLVQSKKHSTRLDRLFTLLLLANASLFKNKDDYNMQNRATHIPLQYCLNFHQLCGAKLKGRTVTVLASNLAAHNECCCEKTRICFCTLPGLSLTSWDSRAPSPYHSMTARTLQQWMARRKTTRQLEPHRRTTTPLCTPPSPTMVRAFALSTSFSKCLHLPNF